MNRTSTVQVQEATFDPRVNHKVRTFLWEINKDRTPLWQPPQPKPQDRSTGLQNMMPVEMSGVGTSETTIRTHVEVVHPARPPPGESARPLARWR